MIAAEVGSGEISRLELKRGGGGTGIKMGRSFCPSGERKKRGRITASLGERENSWRKGKKT